MSCFWEGNRPNAPGAFARLGKAGHGRGTKVLVLTPNYGDPGRGFRINEIGAVGIRGRKLNKEELACQKGPGWEISPGTNWGLSSLPRLPLERGEDSHLAWITGRMENEAMP
jgi:hypothetical protein